MHWCGRRRLGCRAGRPRLGWCARLAAGHDAKQPHRLLGGEALSLLGLGLRHLHGVAGVAHHQLVQQRLLHHLLELAVQLEDTVVEKLPLLADGAVDLADVGRAQLAYLPAAEVALDLVDHCPLALLAKRGERAAPLVVERAGVPAHGVCVWALRAHLAGLQLLAECVQGVQGVGLAAGYGPAEPGVLLPHVVVARGDVDAPLVAPDPLHGSPAAYLPAFGHGCTRLPLYPGWFLSLLGTASFARTGLQNGI